MHMHGKIIPIQGTPPPICLCYPLALCMLTLARNRLIRHTPPPSFLSNHIPNSRILTPGKGGEEEEAVDLDSTILTAVIFHVGVELLPVTISASTLSFGVTRCTPSQAFVRVSVTMFLHFLPLSR